MTFYLPPYSLGSPPPFEAAPRLGGIRVDPIAEERGYLPSHDAELSNLWAECLDLLRAA